MMNVTAPMIKVKEYSVEDMKTSQSHDQSILMLKSNTPLSKYQSETKHQGFSSQNTLPFLSLGQLTVIPDDYLYGTPHDLSDHG